MSVALVGGLDRLKRQYESAAQQYGITLKIFNGKEAGLGEKMGNPEMVILLTAMVSHSARLEVMHHGRSVGAPIVFLHSCGVSGLRRHLAGIQSVAKA
jgi:hypothetical protein